MEFHDYKESYLQLRLKVKLVFQISTKGFFHFRLPPTRPITLHQKALFCFWLSVILIWVGVKSKRYILKWRDKWKAKKEGEDADEKGNDRRVTHLPAMNLNLDKMK